MKKRVLFFLCFLFFTQQLYSEPDSRFPFFESPRLSAFGGAGTALADGEEAVFLNPSLLTTKKEPQLISALSPTVTYDVGAYKTKFNLKAMQSAEYKALTEDFELDKKGSLYISAQNHTGFLLDKSAFGIMSKSYFQMKMDDNRKANYDDRRLQMQFITTHTAYFGISHSFFDFLDVGVMGRFVYKLAQILDKTMEEIHDKTDDDPKIFNQARETEGLGLGGDVGVTYHFPVKAADITAAIVAQNLFELHYLRFNDKQNLPNNEPMALNFGLGYKQEVQEGQELRVAADIKDLTSQYGTNILNKFHFGVMWKYLNWASVSTGLRHGYPSLGFSLAYKFVELQFAHYSVEFGDKLGSKPNTRNALMLRFGWLF